MAFQPMNYGMGMNMMMPRGFQSNPPAELYIGNLDEAVHEEQLYSHFAKYGKIHSVRIVKDKITGKSRGYGYVNFENLKDAENARLLSQYEKIGRLPIRIDYKGDPKQKAEANLFVKNIDTAVTEKDLHNHFSTCGTVVSVKIANDKSGNSLGYGYVQFEKAEDAAKAVLELDGCKLKEQNINVEQFKRRDDRSWNTNNNIYVKHLPIGKSKEEIEKLLSEVFGKYGKIESLVANNKDENTWSAFICYEDSTSAEKALNSLNGKVTLDGADQPLYVNLHSSRDQRADQTQDSTQNNASIFIKNLKPEVKETQIVEALQPFGEIVGSSLKQKVYEGKEFGMAIIHFKYPQDAVNAQCSAKNKEEIKKLFHNEEPYIGFLMNKEKYDQFKQIRTNKIPPQLMSNPYNYYPGMYPMQMYPYMPQFPTNYYQQYYGGMGQQSYQPPMQSYYPQQQRPNWMGNQYSQQQQQPYQQSQQFGQQQGYQPRPYQQQYQQQQQSNYKQKQGGSYGNQYQRSQGRPYQGQQQRPMGQSDQSYNSYNKGQNQKPKQNQQSNQKSEDSMPGQRTEKEATSTSTQSQQAQLTVQNLKDKLDEFMKLDTERQRNILGDMLFPKVLGLSGPTHAPKITGMLVDFEVLSLQEILEFLENNEILKERVQEAQELIEQEDN